MKNIFLGLLFLCSAPVKADIVSTDANGQISVQTVRSNDLCVNNSGAGACGTMRAGIGVSGRLGVGTTDPQTLLDVAGAAQFGSGTAKSTFTAAGVLQLVSGFSASTGAFTGVLTVGGATEANGTLIVQSTSTTSGNPIANFQSQAGVSQFRFQQDGRLGVGATGVVTTYTADIQGASGSVRILDSSGGNPVLYLSSGNAGVKGTLQNNLNETFLTASGGIGFYPQGTRTDYIDGAGNFGINLTTAGITTLDVNGNAQIGSGATKSTFTTTGALTLASGAALTASGAAGNLISASSITTTSGLFGNSLAVAGSSITTAGALTLTPGAAITVAGAGGNIIGVSSITTSGGLFAGTAGIGVTVPVTTLDVGGDFQFGSGATKSTGSTTGSLTLAAGATLTSQSSSLRTITSSVTLSGSGMIIEINDTGNNPIEYFKQSGTTYGQLQTSANIFYIDSSNGNVLALNANRNGNITVGAGGGTTTISNGLTVSGGAGTTPVATFSPNLSSSTTSGTLSGTFTNTALGPCISGSTITLTLPTNVGKIMAVFNGSISNDGLNNVMVVGVLVDGAFVNGQTSTLGLVSAKEQVATDDNNMSFSAVVTGLSAATHNICLTARVSAGTGTIDSTNSIAKLAAYMLP